MPGPGKVRRTQALSSESEPDSAGVRAPAQRGVKPLGTLPGWRWGLPWGASVYNPGCLSLSQQL